MSAIPKTPPLEPGDHLTVAEFERRYQAMPDLKKAELIDGIVYIPTRFGECIRGVSRFNLIAWLGIYHVFTPATAAGAHCTLKLPRGENMPQPDMHLRMLPEFGGQSSVGADGYLFGVPELVAEAAASSASYDLHEKLRAYQRNGVREYVVWRTRDHALDWFILRGSKFHSLNTDKGGLLKSKCFPGLWLDADALLGGDMAKVYNVTHEGLASAEHQRFVKKMEKKKK